jgi:hypothetical protein
MTNNQLDLFIEKLGGREIFDDVLNGRKIVYVKEPELMLFDDFGHKVPENVSTGFSQPEQEFNFDLIRLKDDDCQERLKIFQQYGFDEITVQEFKTKIKELVTIIEENPWINNVLKGPWLPIIVPKTKIYSGFDQLIRHDIELAGESYRKFFPNRKFSISQDLISCFNQVTLSKESRQESLFEIVKKRPVIGIHFPTAFQGFSVQTSREQMKNLPDRFHLSGIDTIWATIMYPDVLAKNFNVPGIYLSGLNFSSKKTLYFRVLDQEFIVLSMPALKNHADGGTTSGLFFY